MVNSVMELAKQFWDGLLVGVGDIFTGMGVFFSRSEDLAGFYTLLTRWLLPILTVAIFVRCVLPLLHQGKQQEAWGYLEMPNGIRMPLMHWENLIGRSKLCDVIIDLPFVSRNHAVLKFDDGGWSVSDIGSKAGIQVNGQKIERPAKVQPGDIISLGECGLMLLPAEIASAGIGPQGIWARLERLGSRLKPRMTLLLMVLFQLLGWLQLSFAMGEDLIPAVPVTFLLFILAECLYYFIMRRRGGKYIELELLAYFLCGLGLFVVASAAPGSLYKQLTAILLGVVSFIVLSEIIRDMSRARKLKYVLVIGSLILLILNLTIGETRFGAKNWINFGFITFQPFEFIKVAFVLAGAATLDRLLTTRNLTAFIGFSGVCIGALFLIRDMGTALIFFGAFLVIAFMRSGDVRTIAFISAGAALGACAVVIFLPYIASRFAAWGHVWEYADSIGYQQTRTMIAAASGGLLGVGGGNGYLVNIAASDTDLVFGMLCEEWGLIVAVTVVMIIAFFAVFAALSVKRCRSSFFAIAACGAAAIFLLQTALNVFGSVDLLPLTGVTMPFVSNGGSSVIASWGLLAFIKAVDERRRPEQAYISRENGECYENSI